MPWTKLPCPVVDIQKPMKYYRTPVIFTGKINFMANKKLSENRKFIALQMESCIVQELRQNLSSST